MHHKGGQGRAGTQDMRTDGRTVGGNGMDWSKGSGRQQGDTFFCQHTRMHADSRITSVAPATAARASPGCYTGALLVMTEMSSSCRLWFRWAYASRVCSTRIALASVLLATKRQWLVVDVPCSGGLSRGCGGKAGTIAAALMCTRIRYIGHSGSPTRCGRSRGTPVSTTMLAARARGHCRWQ